MSLRFGSHSTLISAPKFHLQLQQLFVISFLRSYLTSLPTFFLYHLEGRVRKELYGAAMMIRLTLLG
jgi:hypothetical protein